MTKKQIQNFLVAFTTDRMTEYMIEDYNVTLSDALKFIYNSETLPHHNESEPNHHI